MVNSPRELRALPESELPELAREVRERLVDVVSAVGGHFAASLGVVELTIALHYVFDTPTDQLVWDVGHQAYPHKMLTGRNDALPTIRRRGGLSGFLARHESEYDSFGAGHAATSISAALGMASARDLNGADFNVVAVIGDGAITSGIAYEALNNAGHTDRDLIIILNDNKMSISPNVGALHEYLMRSVQPGVLFEELGFHYVGPVDGHDLSALIGALRAVKSGSGPRLLHVVTTKGKGFSWAEENPVKWHGPTPFDKNSGEMAKKPAGMPAYTEVFGRGLVDLAALHPQVVAITAAMPTGTGTASFADMYPNRFFDVGIAEGHAITFAAGLATQGIRPVAAIYSTFLQRAYDSIIHDVALQELPVVMALDRAGLVGNDGPTHMGLYDIAYLLAVPNMIVTAPKDGDELLALLRLGVQQTRGPFALRFPRDNVPAPVRPVADIASIELGTWEVLRYGQDVALLAVGTMVLPALRAAAQLEREGIDATVVNCRFLKPVDETTLHWVLQAHDVVVSVEEGTIVNGFGASLAARAGRARFELLGVPDRVVQHANRDEQLAAAGLDASGITRSIHALVRPRIPLVKRSQSGLRASALTRAGRTNSSPSPLYAERV